MKKGTAFLHQGFTRNTTHNINCNSETLIYMVQCNRCLEQSEQYTFGETKRRLEDRFNEHRRPVGKPTNVSKPTRPTT